MSVELKPCPFCGEDTACERKQRGYDHIYCCNCFCQTDNFDDMKSAIKAWNTRQSDADGWVIGNGTGAKGLIVAEIEHYNKQLGLEKKYVVGEFKDDGFYFSDEGELSNNWNILKWKNINP